MTSPDYDSYMRSPVWYDRTARFQRYTGKRCALFFWLPSNVSHHMTYRNLGHEKYIRDCIPLSHAAHQWIHYGFIGSWFWDARKVRKRRSVMNFVLRILALCVTLYAAYAGVKKPKIRKPKTRKNRKKSHV